MMIFLQQAYLICYVNLKNRYDQNSSCIVTREAPRADRRRRIMSHWDRHVRNERSLRFSRQAHHVDSNRSIVSESDLDEQSSSSMAQPPTISEGLLLYYHHYSFYAQKVVMALHEKGLSFEPFIINIAKGEQYEEWFLKLNPLGEVPVLQDGCRIIPDSAKIIDYLDMYFSDGNRPRLIPLDEDLLHREHHFRSIIDQLPEAILTLGSFYHPEITKEPKAPFYAPVRKALKNNEQRSIALLFSNAERLPKFRSHLLRKAHYLDQRHRIICNLNEYMNILNRFQGVMDQVEAELATHNGDKEFWWLVCDQFTAADISLTILLERLNNLGLEHRFWQDNRRPFIEKYFERVQQRDSYQKTMPTKLMHVRLLLGDKAHIYFGVGIVATIGASLYGCYYGLKKLKVL